MKVLWRSFLVLGLAGAACAHSKAPIAKAAPPPAPVVEPAPPPPAPEPAPIAEAQPRSCTSDTSCDASQLCIQSTCTDITAAMAECGISRVHFDLDRADLQPADLPVLDRAIRCSNASHTHLLITGNADERGPVKYNLDLGERRAQAVQAYLSKGGVPDGQMEVVTYGKELPVCVQHDEACWSRNRRASLEPNGLAKDIGRLIRKDELASAKSRKAASTTTAQASTPTSSEAHKPVQGRRSK